MKIYERALVVCGLFLLALTAQAEQPNLLIIHTDEHNFRTLGCYRDLMTEDQAFVWGQGVKVDTPHIDSLAHAGAICTSYYAASPVCTPSRASLISGLYPIHTGSPSNDMPLNDGLVTFAEVLKNQGYATSYVGKWHLDGDDKPGFEPARKFGFDDNRYMFNRGHWKVLRQVGDSAEVVGQFNKKTNQYKFSMGDADEQSFTTDFLVDRTLEIIERDKGGPFCVMLSIPDPHGPNHVRKPYDTMFADMHFQNPRTMDAATTDTVPGWVSITGKNSAEKGLKQETMQWYFGMVKCIDDNVGRILAYLKKNGLEKNTIVVFTSDHGDLMGEHKKHNKGNPYEGSARIPFVIRWPGSIPAGKIVRAAYTTVDFTPTVLGLMGAPQIPGSQGTDASRVFQGSKKVVVDDRIVYLTNAGGRWAAAVNNRYKLVLSTMDEPWLFDLKVDPDELTNFYSNPEYRPIAGRFKAELVSQMERYGDPARNSLRLEHGVEPAAAASKGVGKSSAGDTELNMVNGAAEAQNLSVDATGNKASMWSRVCSVPAGSFEADSSYSLHIDWESKGLADDAVFYANFVGDKGDKNKRDLHTWTGSAGDAGVVEKELVTGAYAKWTLKVGVRGSGHLVVKQIQIKKVD